MTFRKLIWEQLDGTFGKDFFAEIKDFENKMIDLLAS